MFQQLVPRDRLTTAETFEEAMEIAHDWLIEQAS